MMNSTTYQSWISDRAHSIEFDSAPMGDISDDLYPHQKALVQWALIKGRSAIFADTGLGKTIMQLEWARHVSTSGRVLILAPLAVAAQTVAEGDTFGISVKYLREDDHTTPIVITNYEMVEAFNPSDFVGIVLDESSILKSFTGKTRNMLITRFAKTPYRLACTATPAPNDFTELGNHSEFLGVKSRVEMLAEYFVHDGGSSQDWRLKGHAVDDFWTWLAGWGAVVKSPSDIGYDGSMYELPELHWIEHVIEVDHSDYWSEGHLFAAPAVTLSDQRVARRSTIEHRAEIIAKIAADHDDQLLVWAELNAEADMVESMVPDSEQVAGRHSPELKRDRLIGFANNAIRVLVTKAKIAGFGMNWQNCNRMVFVGASHSYEQTYQAIRRCWRFGQQREVFVHVIRAETEDAVLQNYRKKEARAADMAKIMTSKASEALKQSIGATSREWNEYKPTITMTIPEWLRSE